MPLRLLQATVPEEDFQGLEEVFEGVKVVDVWTTMSQNGTGIARVLLDAEDTEALTDRLMQRFGTRAGFRIVLLPVEATLPAVEEPEEETAEGGDGEAQGAAGDGGGSEDEAATPRRISREELYEDIAEASKLTRVYGVMVALSTVVAAVGLIRGDVAIIIGAMVIAPLLGPNIALSLASTLGDVDLARRSLKAIAVGVGIAALASVLMGVILDVDPSAPELVSRTDAGLGDIVLALSAGAAGSLAFTSGVPAVVVGVMVAVALLPPLVAAGLLAGAGHGALALGAMILVFTNVACVNLAAVATFLVQRVRPRTWWEGERAKRATRIAVVTWLVLVAGLAALILLT